MSRLFPPFQWLKVVFCFAFLLPSFVAQAQVSPVRPGATKQEIRREYAGRWGSQGYRLQESNDAKWLIINEDSANYRAKITVEFDGDRSKRVLTEWTGLDSTYRFTMLGWYEMQVEALDANARYQRDRDLEAKLVGSFRDTFAKAAVFATEDQSHRYVLLLHATKEGAFFSHLEQAYFWE